VSETPGEYVIELDVTGFAPAELSVELLGHRVTVKGMERATPERFLEPWRLHERIAESFRLADDADPERLSVFLNHGKLEFHAPRRRLESRRVPIEPPPIGLNPDAAPC
jgi:HSP20 family molecular chaperone IbpA